MRCTLLAGEFPCAIYRVNVDGTGLKAVTRLHIERGDFARCIRRTAQRSPSTVSEGKEFWERFTS